MTKRNHLPIILEICGIPYVGKSTAIRHLSSILNQENIKYEIIVDEFREKKSVYDILKHSPDLNLARAFRMMDKIIELSRVSDCQFIIIERGLFDMFCWTNFFLGTKCQEYEKLIPLFQELIEVVNIYCEQYFVAWIDGEPVKSVSHHSHTGSIVNLHTLNKLREEYQEAELKVAQSPLLKIKRINNAENSYKVAEKLIRYCKVLK